MENSTIMISYKIKGVIEQARIHKFFEQMGVIAKEDNKINLVLEVYRIDSLRNINEFFSDLNSKQKALRHLRKFALIANTDWIEELGNFVDFLTPGGEVEVFDLSEREEANAWVQSPTKKEDRDIQERVRQGYAHLLD